MSIRIMCPSCKAPHSVNERLLGGKLHCPKCEGEIQMPSREQYDAALAKKRLREEQKTGNGSATVSPATRNPAASAATTPKSPASTEKKLGTGSPEVSATQSRSTKPPIALAKSVIDADDGAITTASVVPRREHAEEFAEAIPVAEAIPIADAIPVAEAVPVAEAMSGDEEVPVAQAVRAGRPMEVRAAVAESKKSVPPKKPQTLSKKPAKKEEEEEPPALGPSKNRDNTEMDMTPMIDVTFLLLIFFVVTASFQMQKAMEVPKSKTDAPSSTSEPEPEEQVEEVTVQIDPNNTYMVLAPDWEREVPGRQNLMNALREARAAVDEESPMKLKIEAHVDSKHKAVVEALDVGAELKFSELTVVELEELN